MNGRKISERDDIKLKMPMSMNGMKRCKQGTCMLMCVCVCELAIL